MINLYVEGAGVDGGGMGGVLHRQERLDGAHLGINYAGLDHDNAFGWWPDDNCSDDDRKGIEKKNGIVYTEFIALFI